LELVDGLLTGCAFDDPGLESLEADEPDEDFLTLDPAAVIVFEVISVDPGLSVWTPGFADRLDAPGEQWQMGPTPFHENPTWHIDANHPAYDPGAVYSMSFKFLDTGSTAYAESEVYTIRFQCAARGACCIKGGCEDEFEGLCLDEGGRYLGDNTACGGDADGDGVLDCDEVAVIPTTSEWGLIVLALSLLALAKAVGHRFSTGARGMATPS
jgi:hypothetical protein